MALLERGLGSLASRNWRGGGEQLLSSINSLQIRLRLDSIHCFPPVTPSPGNRHWLTSISPTGFILRSCLGKLPNLPSQGLLPGDSAWRQEYRAAVFTRAEGGKLRENPFLPTTRHILSFNYDSLSPRVHLNSPNPFSKLTCLGYPLEMLPQIIKSRVESRQVSFETSLETPKHVCLESCRAGGWVGSLVFLESLFYLSHLRQFMEYRW